MRKVKSKTRYITTSEVAERLCVSEWKIAQNRKSYIGLPYYRFGKSVRYRLKDVILYERACRVRIPSVGARPKASKRKVKGA